MILTGTPVFPGAGQGRCWRWSDVVDGHAPPFDDAVIVAAHFHNELALWAIERCVVGVLTDHGSFACHAANLLRAAQSAGHATPFWFSRFDHVSELPSGLPIRCISDGTVSDRLEDPENVGILSDLPSPSASPTREISAYDAVNGRWWRCYWPHRQYDRLLGSVMCAGLRHDAALGANEALATHHGTDGLLWFTSDSPSTTDLIRRAVVFDDAETSVQTQMAVYHAINVEMRALDDEELRRSRFAALLMLLERYFSHFMAYHNTYEHVFLALAARLQNSVSRKTISALLDRVMTPEIIRWQHQTRLALANRKDLLEALPPVSAPPFSIHDDDQTSTQRVCDVLGTLSDVALKPADLAYARYATHVAVIKEWKFFINKMLFSRFATWIREIPEFAHAPQNALREMTVEEIRAVLS